MSRPLIGSGQWSKTTTGITRPAARLCGREANRGCSETPAASRLDAKEYYLPPNSIDEIQ